MKLASFLLLPLLAATSAAHPVHVTFGEVDFNSETGRLEVALVVDSIDLEDALGRRSGERIDLEKTPDVDRRITAYLTRVFQVRPAGSDRPAPIQWVGKEIKVRRTWLFFEVVLTGPPTELEFTNSIFFELAPEQINTLEIEIGEKKATIRLNRERPRRTI